MKGIIVDTSSILFALSNKIDVFKEVEKQLDLTPVISEGVVRELKNKASGRNRPYAMAALELIKLHKIRIEKGNEHVDKWIIDNAGRFSYVCTNDSALRKELRLRGISVCAVSASGSLR